MTERALPRNTGEALLLRLKQLGVDYFYANPGTEFVSVIHGFRELPSAELPEPVLVPHEFLAVSMAYGAYLATGRPQAVMTHATVGAANAVIGLIAAARMNIPLIYISGMTSATERGGAGRRDKLIHWAQEAKDQGSMYREYVKWEAVIRDPASIYDVLDRAFAISMSEPRGPVAVSISRDVLISVEGGPVPADIQVRPTAALVPANAAMEEFFTLLSQARKPLVVTNRLGADAAAVGLLVQAAERHGLGVSTPDDFYLSFPSLHPQHLGFKQGVPLAEADLVLVIDTEVPWYPLENGPGKQARVVHVGPDPLAESIPLRSHRGDLFIRGNVSEFLRSLARRAPQSELTAERKSWCAAMRKLLPPPPAGLDADLGTLTAATVSAVLSESLGEDTFLVNELGLVPEFLRCRHPGTYFRSGGASALGWGVGCGLGLAMSRPGWTAIVSVGDGVFFLSPVNGVLLLSAQRKIPFVLLVLNNGGMRSVAAATREFYPGAVGDLPLTTMPLEGVRLDACADFVGGWGASASTASELRRALAEAVSFTRTKGKPAIIEVLISA